MSEHIEDFASHQRDERMHLIVDVLKKRESERQASDSDETHIQQDKEVAH